MFVSIEGWSNKLNDNNDKFYKKEGVVLKTAGCVHYNVRAAIEWSHRLILDSRDARLKLFLRQYLRLVSNYIEIEGQKRPRFQKLEFHIPIWRMVVSYYGQDNKRLEFCNYPQDDLLLLYAISPNLVFCDRLLHFNL